MQLSNLVLRLGGSQLHTVPKTDVTPAEILVLQRIHGEDAIVDVRPTRVDKNRRHASEFERLQNLYDRASAFASAPGEENKSIMNSLFPGAMKKLPLTLREIGLGHFMSPASIAAAERKAGSAVPAPDDVDETELMSAEPVEDEPGDESEDGTGEGNLAETGAE